MQVAVLGPLEVRDRDVPVIVSGSRVRRLLVRLAVDAGRAVSADELVDAVWPSEEPPANVHNALQALVSRLRKALSDAKVIEQRSNGYRLVLEPGSLDVDEFVRLAREGRDLLGGGKPDAAVTSLRSAIELWRGEALADADSAEYAQTLVVRWNEQRLQAIADLARACIQQGSAGDEVAGLQELVTAHPLRDDFVELLMRSLDQSGRTPEALAAYEAHRELLADELGSDPTPVLQALHLELLRAKRAEPTQEPVSNVPSALTRLVGRDDEVARVSKMLQNGRLVSIVGPGGAGKTRLATELVDKAMAAPGLRAWFVDLAPVTELTGVVQAFGAVDGLLDRHVLDVPGERVSVDPIDRLIDWLRGRDALLLVDNCEQVLDPTANVVSRLLGSCPRLRVLATSREPLNIPGETVCLLAPLSFPDGAVNLEDALAHPAIQLFAERAQDASADFVLDESTLASVTQIVRNLDGLPLALELAAARLRVLPVAEVERRLTDRFSLLTGGSRTAMPRHQTLRAVVEWSWDLLTEPERLLLERLSVFPSGASPGAAGGVCADSLLSAALIPDLLDSLVDKSLLRLTGDAELRYRMLDTIRAFGNERLQARHEATIAGRAHAAYFADLAIRLEPELREASQLEAIAELGLERDNILTALRFFGDHGEAQAAMDLTLAMSWYWTMMGSHSEAAYWSKFALDAGDSGDARSRTVLETFYLLGSLATDSNDAGTWQEVREQMMELSDRLGQFEFDEPPLLALRPMITYFAGDPERADELSIEPLSSSDPWTRAATRTFRAAMAENEGDIERMKADLDAGAKDLELVGDRWLLGSSFSTRARVRMLDGDLDGAVDDYERAAASLEDIGAPDDVAFIYLRLAELAIRRHDLAGARRHSLRMKQVIEDWRPGEMFVVAFNLTLARLEDNPEEGDACYERLQRSVTALQPDHPIQDHTRSLQFAALATYDLWRGRTEAARQHLVMAYPAAMETHDMPIVSIVGVAIADLALAMGNGIRAAQILGAAASVRGSDDETDPEIIRVGDALGAALGDGFDQEYSKGRRLSRDEALPLLDPTAL